MGFFKPNWRSNNLKRAEKAIDNETDQLQLLDAAKNAQFDSIRVAAVIKLSRKEHQFDLETIATSDKSSWVRREATKKLENQSVIEAIATTERDDTVRKEAIEKVQNQSVLETIATTDNNDELRRNAIKKITNRAILINVAVKNNKDTVWCYAFEMVYAHKGKDFCKNDEIIKMMDILLRRKHGKFVYDLLTPEERKELRFEIKEEIVENWSEPNGHYIEWNRKGCYFRGNYAFLISQTERK